MIDTKIHGAPPEQRGILTMFNSYRGTPIAEELGDSLASLFAEWDAINRMWRAGASDAMSSVFMHVCRDLECRMQAAGVHSAADAAAAFAWLEDMVDASGWNEELAASLRDWLNGQVPPPAPEGPKAVAI